MKGKDMSLFSFSVHFPLIHFCWNLWSDDFSLQVILHAESQLVRSCAEGDQTCVLEQWKTTHLSTNIHSLLLYNCLHLYFYIQLLQKWKKKSVCSRWWKLISMELIFLFKSSSSSLSRFQFLGSNVTKKSPSVPVFPFPVLFHLPPFLFK
jgi:hypothetical protein